MQYIPGIDSSLDLDEEQTISNLLKLGMLSLVETHCEAILSELLDMSPFDLYKNLSMPVSEEIERSYWQKLGLIALGSVCKNSKLDIINSINFCGNQLIINENVLTPHLQTQEVTYATIGYIKEIFAGEQSLSALDMCCGCGAIGLSIKSAIKQIDMTSVDISKDALEVLELNAKKLGIAVTPIQSDLFSKVNGRYDIITANPPYLSDINNIPFEVQKLIDRGSNDVIWFQGVLGGEPSIAMIAEENGLKFYYKIIEQLDDYLNQRGLVVLEFGSKSQQNEIDNIIKNNLYEAETYYLYSSKKDSPRAAFIFRGVSAKEIEQATPKVLKLIPNIQTSIGKSRFNIGETRIKKLDN